MAESQEKQVSVETQKVDPEKRLKLQADFNTSLAKFRSQVKAPAKNGHVGYSTKNGAKNYDYVLLDDLIKSIDTGLKDTGLAWYQEASADMKTVRVRTVITHSSGFIYQSPWITFMGGTPQNAGSAITYAKRYSLGASFGISSETDDDGKTAQTSQSRQPKNNNQYQSQGNNNRSNQRQNGRQSTQNTGSATMGNGPLKQAMRQIELISQATGRDQAEIYKELIGQTGYADSELNETKNAVVFFNAAKDMRHSVTGGN